MTQIAPQIVQITRAASAAQFMWEVIDHEPSIDALSTLGKQPETCRGEIQFSNIAFSYPTRPQVRVLEDFTLAVPANKTTALVGPSGSGKSTISALLERWYDPLEGGVLLDGMDIRELNVRWLRTSVRIVQQEPTLFNGTVFENVAYGLAGTEYINASREEQLERVIEACKAAYAHEFIEGLPEVRSTDSLFFYSPFGTTTDSPERIGLRHPCRRTRERPVRRPEATDRNRSKYRLGSKSAHPRRSYQRA